MKGIMPIIGAVILLAIVALFAMKPAAIYNPGEKVAYQGLTCTVTGSSFESQRDVNTGEIMQLEFTTMTCSDGKTYTILSNDPRSGGVKMVLTKIATPTPTPTAVTKPVPVFGVPAPDTQPAPADTGQRIPVISDIGDFLAGIIGAIIGFIAIPFLPP